MTPRSERRRAQRVRERLSVTLRDAAAEFQAETNNLSTIGAYCTLDRFLAPMTKLQLHFELPDGARRVTVNGEGVVVRVDPVVADAERGRYQIGIFFTEMADHDRAAIERFVRQRLAERPSTP